MKQIEQYANDREVDRIGTALGQVLREHENAVPDGVAQRLRIARLQAVQRQTVMRLNPAPARATAPAAARPRPGQWKKWLAALPLAAAGAGAVFMQGAVSDDGVGGLVEADLQILASEVPPTAFSDPAFVQFLKARQIEFTPATSQGVRPRS